MKVEILTPFLHDGAKFEEGEVRLVDDATGDYFCRAGWGKDLSGTVATASPAKDEVVLVVDNSKRSNSVEEIL